MSPPCVLCGPGQVETCARCGSTLDHRHVQIARRDGSVESSAVVCVRCIATLEIRGKPMTAYLDDKAGGA